MKTRALVMMLALSSVNAQAQDNAPPYEATQPPPPPPSPSQGVPQSGVLVKVGLGVAFVNPATVLPSITVGYRLIDRLELRLSAQFGYAGATANPGGANGTWFVDLAPGLEVDIARLMHRRVALEGIFTLPIGAAGSTAAGTSATLLIGFTAGLGLRFAIVPAFTVGFEGGIIGLFQVATNGGGSSDSVGFYGMLSGTMYFGH